MSIQGEHLGSIREAGGSCGKLEGGFLRMGTKGGAQSLMSKGAKFERTNGSDFVLCQVFL